MLTDEELTEVFDEMRLNEVVMYMDRKQPDKPQKSEDQKHLKEAVIKQLTEKKK